MGRRAIVLLVALVLAGVAAWAVWNYLQGIEDDLREDQVIVTVFRAGSTIPEGTDGGVLLSDFNSQGQLIVESEDQAGDVPEGTITTVEQLNAVLAGKVAAGPISAGSILTESQWTTITVDIVPLAEKIPPGKQAMTISADNVRGVNGFVEPGDRINMILTIEVTFDLLPEDFSGITVEDPAAPPEDETTQDTGVTVIYTRFVLQGIPVLATGREVRPDPDAPETVEVTPAEGEEVPTAGGNETVFTLEVTPEQAERIAYAMENGSIWLTLVPADFVEVETTGVIIDNLFGGDLAEDIFGTGN